MAGEAFRRLSHLRRTAVFRQLDVKCGPLCSPSCIEIRVSLNFSVLPKHFHSTFTVSAPFRSFKKYLMHAVAFWKSSVSFHVFSFSSILKSIIIRGEKGHGSASCKTCRDRLSRQHLVSGSRETCCVFWSLDGTDTDYRALSGLCSNRSETSTMDYL